MNNIGYGAYGFGYFGGDNCSTVDKRFSSVQVGCFGARNLIPGPGGALIPDMGSVDCRLFASIKEEMKRCGKTSATTPTRTSTSTGLVAAGTGRFVNLSSSWAGRFPFLAGAKIMSGYSLHKGPGIYFYIKNKSTGKTVAKGLTGRKSWSGLFKAGSNAGKSTTKSYVPKFVSLHSFWYGKYPILKGAKILSGHSLHKGPGKYFYIKNKNTGKMVVKGLTGRVSGKYFHKGPKASVTAPPSSSSPPDTGPPAAAYYTALPPSALSIGGTNPAILVAAGAAVLIGLFLVLKPKPSPYYGPPPPPRRKRKRKR